MSGPEKDIDIREEMRIALFWRSLISDGEYVKFDPDDMLRWYVALELRGPDEIRELINERYRSRPMPYVVGIVSKAPHPPVWLINEWLEHYEQKTRVAVPVGLGISFVVLSFIGFTSLQGCSQLTNLSPLAMKPPPGTPLVAPYTPVNISYAAAPAVSGAAASQPQAPNVSGTLTQTGPVSGGIAGGAAGVVSTTGATGASNQGASSASAPH